MERTVHQARLSAAWLRAGRVFVNRAEISVTGMDEAIRAVEESADAASLLAMELAIGSFEAGAACTDHLVKTTEHAARAAAEMARLVRSTGLF